MTAVMEPTAESTADQLGRIGEQFRVPAGVGAPVVVAGRAGAVTGADGGYVMVRFHGEDESERCHPRWGIVWLAENGPAGMVPVPHAKPAPALFTWCVGDSQWSGV